ncbi:hypothetical protein Gotur_011187, partial [Gossypium turneri]
SRKKLDIIIPASEIPEWFSQQRGDSSIKIDLPLEVRNDSQWKGVAFCCIFVSGCTSRDTIIVCSAVIHDRYSSQEVNYSGWKLSYNEHSMKDHIFIRYFSRDYLYPISLEDKCGKHDETKNLRTTDCLDQECYQLELSFISVHCRLVKVKKCGVRIVYEKDLEEMEQIQELHSSQYCAKDGSIVFVKEIFLVYPLCNALILVVTISSAYLRILLNFPSLDCFYCQIARCLNRCLSFYQVNKLYLEIQEESLILLYLQVKSQNGLVNKEVTLRLR